MLVILPGMAYLIVAGLNPGIDFNGGSSITLQFASTVEQNDLRFVLASNNQPDAIVQKLEDRMYFVRTTELQEEAKDALVESIKVKLSQEDVKILSFDLVSPIVARETVVAAIWAVIAAAVGIFLYVWWAFRSVPSPFRYGTAAIIALLHDTAVVIGIFAMLGEIYDVEVNTMFLVALLTVIGYSVNDTIVIFDRLRENVLTYSNRKFSDIINLSISESLGRSLNTSLTLVFTLISLLLFGGETIRVFVWVLLIGVIAGTYSSIGIATQVLALWESGDLKRLFRRSGSVTTSEVK